MRRDLSFPETNTVASSTTMTTAMPANTHLLVIPVQCGDFSEKVLDSEVLKLRLKVRKFPIYMPLLLFLAYMRKLQSNAAIYARTAGILQHTAGLWRHSNLPLGERAVTSAREFLESEKGRESSPSA